ncbi:3-oxoacyl-ACP synthase [Polaribacter pacificus]|uniref:3-oxoacyl-ACP synthase n=1 Tax=Polaribacter pacificus TaxID=1775173 RepID=A0A917I1S1_9FLAO|nr:ketoacyl-ACP synthase III [Polaribacter pacificus]GGH01562.1 3-oxoacyl-ACP synthase [Polaribacter pacificus]
MQNTIITGTGCYVPTIVQKNDQFLKHRFLNEDGTPFEASNEEIIQKFQNITGIDERRYVDTKYATSDIAFFAAQKAIEKSGVNPEELDYIILAHNFGDVQSAAIQSDILPCIATRVKHQLKIKNPNCVAYDILFGCPGWIEGVIQAHAFIKAGMAKKVLVIGAETLSRVVDQHDRDTMIFSDGAGASVVEASEGSTAGILSHSTQTFSKDEAYYLSFGKSFDKKEDSDVRYIKMNGRKIYEFALVNVPLAMKAALDKSGVSINDIKKIFIHQANEKMDEAIVKRFYRLFKMGVPEGIMPMNIQKFGNSSVATVPTLLDLVLQGKIENHRVNKGDIVLFASVGAGMNINAIVYKF